MTFNRLAVVVGVLAVAGFGYAAGKSDSAPEQRTVERGKSDRNDSRAGRRDRDRKPATGEARKDEPKTMAVKGEAAPRRPRGSAESITVFGSGFKDGATIEFFDNIHPTVSTTGTLDSNNNLICVPPDRVMSDVSVRVTNPDNWPLPGESNGAIFHYVEQRIVVDHCEEDTWPASGHARLRGQQGAPAKK
jgi:hypothetical protein